MRDCRSRITAPARLHPGYGPLSAARTQAPPQQAPRRPRTRRARTSEPRVFAPGAARDLVARYAAALAPGSYIVLSAGRGDSDAADQGFGAYSAGAVRVYNHSLPEFTSFFGPLELVPPGVVDAREWRPDWEQPVRLPPRDGQVIVGVGGLS